MNEFWDKTDKLDLVRFFTLAKHSKLTKKFIQIAKERYNLPASGYDYNLDQNKRHELIEKIYDILCQQNIEYDLNEYFQSCNQNKQQIRTAEVILQKKGKGKGTCIDLAILFCAICSEFDLLPILIFLDGHVLAAVSLIYKFRDWDNDERRGKTLFYEGIGTLNDKKWLNKVLKRDEYLVVECTGFANSKTLSKSEEDFKRENGLLSFEKAIDFGNKIIEEKQLLFVLDIPIAYNFWLPKVVRDCLNKEAPKSFSNNKNLLDDIYIDLGLIERKKDSQPRPEEKIINPGSPEFNNPDDKYEIVKTYEHDEFFNEVLKNKNSTKTQGKKLFIVGDPGGGKSTLLQKIADWVLKNEQGLPIWIPLAKFNHRLVEEENLNDPGWLYRYISKQWLRNLSQEAKQIPETWQYFFEELHKTHQIWLLLDGADEMAVSYSLKKIQEQLAKGWSKKFRVVVSCRLNLWEQQKDTLSEEFDIYRTLDFHYPKQVYQFINNWFSEEKPKAVKLQNKLEEKNRERLRNLVKNPLRLALLCKLWNKGLATLPKTKADFYKLLVDSHYKWKDDTNKEFEIPSDTKNKLNINLAELAKEAIDNSNFRFRFRKSFITHYLGSPDQDNSLFSWALKLGWLLHIGYPTEGEENLHEEVYAFFHPTFQEYFAATASELNESYDFFLPIKHKNKPLKDKRYRIFEPQWKEVILLWLGRKNIPKEQKDKFITHLLNFRDGSGGFYKYKAYFLAAVGITEFNDCSHTRKIIEEMVKLSCETTDSYFTRKCKLIRKNFWQMISTKANSKFSEMNCNKIISILESLIAESSDVDIRSSALNKLGTIGSTECINTLIHVLEGKIGSQKIIDPFTRKLENPYIVRNLAVSYLEKIPSDISVNPLIKTLENPEDLIYQSVIKVLGKIGSEYAVNPLIKSLENSANNNNIYNISYIAEALGEIGSEHAVKHLIKAFYNYKNRESHIRQKILEALIKIGSKKAIEHLLIALDKQPSHDYSLENQIRKTFVEFHSKNTINSLIRISKNSENTLTISRIAAEVLYEIAPQDAVDHLIEASSNPDRSISIDAIKTLGRIGSNTAINKLIKILEENNDFNSNAAHALGEVGPDATAAIQPLIKNLIESLERHDYSQSEAAAYALGNIGPDATAAIQPLIKALGINNRSLRTSSAKALGQIGSEIAIPHLIQTLENFNYYYTNDVIQTSLEALGNIGSDAVIPPLIQSLKSSNYWLRKIAAEALGNTGSKSAIPPLLQALQDPNPIVRDTSAEALGKIGSDTAVPSLGQALQDSGDYYTGSAAFALAKIGSEAAISILNKSLDSNNEIIIYALQQNKSQATINLTIKALKDSYTLNINNKAQEILNEVSLQPQQISEMITTLKSRYSLSVEDYELIWQHTQNFSYSKFYDVWNKKVQRNNIKFLINKIGSSVLAMLNHW